MSNERKTILIADLGFGDAGKGTMVDYLTRRHHAHTVIRYNGGAQAAHNVVTPDGRHHTFAQFGSGTFVPGTKTHLSQFMMIDPPAMLKEARHLQSLGISDVLERTTADRGALIISPFQQITNRVKEVARGNGRHGSCGMGIGETMSDFLLHGEQVLLGGDLADCATVIKKLRFLRELKLNELAPIIETIDNVDEYLEAFKDADFIDACADLYHYFAQQLQIVDRTHLKQIFDQPGIVIFEGAQGVLLDEKYGFHPYTTWSNITFENADTLLGDYQGQVIRLGVTRAYTPRHGAGPLVTEDANLTTTTPDFHNVTNPWQQNFRVGYFDAVMMRYAIEVMGKVDYLAVTHLDRVLPEWKICTHYHHADQHSSFFRYERDLIRDICVSRPANLNHQEQLTGLLAQCQPCYDVMADVSMIENQLGVPVALVSEGMTADDKRCLLADSGL